MRPAKFADLHRKRGENRSKHTEMSLESQQKLPPSCALYVELSKGEGEEIQRHLRRACLLGALLSLGGVRVKPEVRFVTELIAGECIIEVGSMRLVDVNEKTSATTVCLSSR